MGRAFTIVCDTMVIIYVPCSACDHTGPSQYFTFRPTYLGRKIVVLQQLFDAFIGKFRAAAVE
jgi:hypothetical protein